MKEIVRVSFSGTGSQGLGEVMREVEPLVVVGYDPGGNDKHGVASILVKDLKVASSEVETVATADEALTWFAKQSKKNGAGISGVGVDTLTVWSTGPSGWRPADRYLRGCYPNPGVRNSIAAPNSLRGSMVINGMAVVLHLRASQPQLVISETHPKVLYYALSGGSIYDYNKNAAAMNSSLGNWLGVSAMPRLEDEDQWDALVSALAVLAGVQKRWAMDLHQLPTQRNECLVWPAGPSAYFWPVAGTTYRQR